MGKAYLNDFKRNEKGEYSYEGTFYEWEGAPEAYRRTLLTLWLFGLLTFCGAAGAGFFDAPGAMNCFYVILPYIISLVAACSVLWGMIRLTEGKNPMRSYVYEASVGKLPIRTLLVMIFAGLSVAGEVIYVILNGSEGKSSVIVAFLIFEALASLSALKIHLIIGKMSWKKLEK